MKTWAAGVACLAALAAAGLGLTAEVGPAPAEAAAIAKAVMPSLVHVEYTLQHDKGEPPRSSGWETRCPNCGRYHGDSAEEYVREERPMEGAGFVLSPTHVLCRDVLLHPRFVRRVVVRAGSQAVEAQPGAYATEQNAMILELAQPLQGARPLAFEGGKKPPFYTVNYTKLNGAWTLSVRPLSRDACFSEGGRAFRPVPSYCLIVDASGAAVGTSMRDELPLDDSWQVSPLKWPTLSRQEMSKLLEGMESRAAQGLLRVTLRLRSPRGGRPFERRFSYRDDEREAPERNVSGVLLDGKRVLVLARLRPALTARLERILVHPPQGEPVKGKFVASLRDFGALVADLERPLEGAVPLSPEGILACRNRLLLLAEVEVKGETRLAHFRHARIPSFEVGQRQQVYPELPRDGGFFFDLKGQLLALPIPERTKVSMEERWERDDPRVTPAAYLKEALADLAKSADPSNIPLSEQEESRLAWMGVELQPLTKELARANNVAHLTRDGETGALVSYVYPDSPAAQAGIEQGFLLLRLHVEGHPQPLEIKLRDEGFYDRDPFPWGRLDEMPEEYYERIPPPWPPAETTFTRTLTDIGLGRKYAAEFFHKGKVVTKELAIVQGPPHYESAPRHTSKELGLTVRDLTYEVRRHLQRKPGEPGVIISKVEMGSRASVAGLRPYELVTHVNDAPILRVQDFEKQVTGKHELRLAVTRMTRHRVVEIKTTTPLPKPGPARPAPRPQPGEEIEP